MRPAPTPRPRTVQSPSARLSDGGSRAVGDRQQPGGRGAALRRYRADQSAGHRRADPASDGITTMAGEQGQGMAEQAGGAVEAFGARQAALSARHVASAEADRA